MVLTPILIESDAIPTVQLLYGGIAAFSRICSWSLPVRAAHAALPAGQEVRALMLDGLKHALKVKPFWFYLLISFIGHGHFQRRHHLGGKYHPPARFHPHRCRDVGALMLAGRGARRSGHPRLSPINQHKRKPYLLLGILLAIPGLIGLTFATSLWLLLVSAFGLGFFLISTSPIGMQYAAEITHPTPEGTSNGLIQLFGQASVVFVYIMEALKSQDGAFTPALLVAAGLLVISGLLITRLEEPDRHLSSIPVS